MTDTTSIANRLLALVEISRFGGFWRCDVDALHKACTPGDMRTLASAYLEAATLLRESARYVARHPEAGELFDRIAEFLNGGKKQ